MPAAGRFRRGRSRRGRSRRRGRPGRQAALRRRTRPRRDPTAAVVRPPAAPDPPSPERRPTGTIWCCDGAAREAPRTTRRWTSVPAAPPTPRLGGPARSCRSPPGRSGGSCRSAAGRHAWRCPSRASLSVSSRCRDASSRGVLLSWGSWWSSLRRQRKRYALLEEPYEVLLAQRHAVMVALAQRAAQRQKGVALLGKLDPLGDHGGAGGRSDREHGRDDVTAVRIVGQALHERAIDLDVVERVVLQVRQRGVAGSEVVQRELDAQRVQGVQAVAETGALVDEDALGDLEREAARRNAVARQDRFDVRHEVAVGQLLYADVHRDLDDVQTVVLPGAERPAGAIEDPAPDRHDQAARLRDRWPARPWAGSGARTRRSSALRAARTRAAPARVPPGPDRP